MEHTADKKKKKEEKEGRSEDQMEWAEHLSGSSLQKKKNVGRSMINKEGCFTFPTALRLSGRVHL